MPLAQFKKISSLAAICCSSSCSNREPRWEKNTKKVFCERSKAKYMWVVSMNEQPVGALSGFQEHISSTDESRSQCTECRSSWKLPNVNTMNIAALNSTAHIAALNSTARDCSSCRRVRNYILKFEEVEKKKTSGWQYLKRRSHRASCTVPCIVNSWLHTSHLSSLKVYLQRLASHSVLELQLKKSVDVWVEFKIPVSYILAPYWTLGLMKELWCIVYSRWLIWLALISGFLKLKLN